MAGTDDRKSSVPAGRRTVSAEESELFREAMKDAIPLGPHPAPVFSAPAGPVSERPPGASEAGRRAGPPPLRQNAPTGLDSRTMHRLKRGRIRPEAVLDLHGMTRGSAHAALEGFLARAQEDGKRCVIVVTGKGRVGQGGGVIRTELPHWLNLASNRARILGFAQAQPRDGGAGAFYVLLRRHREER